MRVGTIALAKEVKPNNTKNHSQHTDRKYYKNIGPDSDGIEIVSLCIRLG